MELVHDSPEIPIGMLTNFHLRRCESSLCLLVYFVSVMNIQKIRLLSTLQVKKFSYTSWRR